jgi:hypothetical protein
MKRVCSTEEFRKKISVERKARWFNSAYRLRQIEIDKQRWADSDYHKKQAESMRVYDYPSKEDWFADVGGIRSKFENDLKLSGVKVAYENSFPGIAVVTVNSWFYSIGYEFQKLPKLVQIRSNLERDIEAYLKSLSIECQHASAHSVIPGYELDIYLPKLLIAFELNGYYWHRYDVNYCNGRYKSLHRVKTDLCLQKRILLFHFWDFLLEEDIYRFIDILLFSEDLCIVELSREYSLLSPFLSPEQKAQGCIDRDFCPQDLSSYGYTFQPPVSAELNGYICYNSGIWVPDTLL